MKIFRKKKTASPAQRPSEAELFTDREEFIDAFDDALAELSPEAPRVLVFHGTSGIGKSEIKKELIRRLTKKRDKVTDHDGAPLEENDDYRTIWAAVDFNSPEYRPPERALFKLRNELLYDPVWQIPLRTFDIGFVIRWRKVNPELPLNLENLPGLNDSRIIKDVLELGGEIFPGVKLVGALARLAKDTAGELREWWTVKRSETLQRLEEAEPYEMDKALPGLLADDLLYFLTREKVRVVVFFDAYEKLWETEEDRAAHRYHAVDAWVRDLVAGAGGVLLVITGHDDVRWREIQDDRIKWHEVVTSEHVESLTESDCYTLLERAGITDEPIKEKIYLGSHGVPLYIDLSIDTYYDAIKKGETPNSGDFGGTYDEIFNRFVERLSREEALTLEAIAPARSFDARLFKAVVEHFDTGFPTAAFDDFVRFSFVTEQRDKGPYLIHDLLREHIKAYAGEGKWRKANAFLFDYYRARAEVEEALNITEENLTALGEAVYHGLETGEVEETLRWFNKTQRPYETAALYGELTARYEELIPVPEGAGGRESTTFAAALHNLALLYKAQGRYDDAERRYLRSLEINENVLGPDHPDVAATLNNLAALYYAQGRYADAEPRYLRSLDINVKALDPDHPAVAAALNNLAGFYYAQGRYADAEPLYERSLEIYEKVIGPDHPNVAAALNNLAALYYAQGRYADAERLYKRSLKIRENALGPDHPDVANSLNNLAGLYAAQGRYADAEPLYERSLEIREKTLGPDHPDVATTLNNLASLYTTQGRYADAEPLYQRNLKITEKALGPDHPDVATSLNNLAYLYDAQGRYADAEPRYLRSLEIREKALGPDHPDVATSLNNLALLYKAQRRYADAEPLYLRSLEKTEKALGSDHPDVATSLNNLAALYDAQGRYADAEPRFVRSMEIREKALGPDHPDVAASLNNLAALFYETNRKEESVPYLERALSIFSRALPPNHPNTITVLESLAVIYAETDDQEKAAEYAKRAEELKKSREEEN